MKYKKNILLIVLVIIVILCLLFTSKKLKEKEDSNTTLSKEEVKDDNNVKDDTYQEQLDELIKETGKQGENDLYEIQQESDNTKVATIKGSMKYKVAFAGMVKGSKPEKSELDDILNNNQPREKGIWIRTCTKLYGNKNRCFI